MKILVINGPNLNFLGKRDAKLYGKITLAQIMAQLVKIADKADIKLEVFQSNHEGAIIDFLQNDTSRLARGILINPGALTHYGYSLRDALIDTKLPLIEIHLSDPDTRESFRKIDVLDGVTVKKFKGLQQKSYYQGLEYLINLLKKK